jgi:undecaprenyl-diphosphatase
MLDFFYGIDLQIFYFINHTLSNPLFDKFFPFITEVKNWYIAYVLLFLLLVIKGGRTGRIAALLLLVMIAATDQLSSFFIKNLVHRIRPCNILPDVRILVTCTQAFSFPSSHAVNNFAAATYFYRLYPKYKWPLFIAAFLLAFSRPYVGVHYPSDSIGGAIIGAAFGYLFSVIALKIDSLFDKNISPRFTRIK